MEQPNGSASSSHPDERSEPSARTVDENGLPVSPPYWQSRARANSNLSDVPSSSQPSISNKNRLSGPIRLRDNSAEESSDQARACWAKSVRIDDYVIVSGSVSKAGLGSYVVWNCTVETLMGGSFKIRKRYSEFDKLRSNLVKTFPHAGAALPEIPPKSIVHRFQTKFLEKRKVGLAHFLHCVLLNPEFSGSPIVKDFLFSS